MAEMSTIRNVVAAAALLFFGVAAVTWNAGVSLSIAIVLGFVWAGILWAQHLQKLAAKTAAPTAPPDVAHVTLPASSSASPQVCAELVLTGPESGDFVVSWSPVSYLAMTAHHGYPPNASTGLAVKVFNVGPGTARHIKLMWSIDGLDVMREIEQIKLFEGHIHSQAGNSLTLVGATPGGNRHGTIITFASLAEANIPRLDEGGEILQPIPREIQNTLFAWALTKSKEASAAARPLDGLGEVMDHMLASTIPVFPLKVDVSFADHGERKGGKTYSLVGNAFLNVSTIAAIPDENGDYQIERDGTSVGLHGLALREVQ